MSTPNEELVPRLRLEALKAVNEAINSKTKKDRAEGFAAAYAYCKAIELANADGAIEARHGIVAPAVGNYLGWMIPAGVALKRFLGGTQWEALGFAAVMAGLS